MPSLNLLYFDGRGRAEPTRLALLLGDIPFDDERFQFSEFPDLKSSGRLPFGQVPLMRVDDVEFTQSEALMRYAGRLSGLYPRDDDMLALHIDEVLGVVGEDVLSKMFKYRGNDAELKKAAREEFLRDDVPRFFGGLEKIVKAKATSETWLCGDSISIADLALYFVVGNVKHGNVEHVPSDAFDAYPRLIASYEAVHNHPKVHEWNEKHPWKTNQ